MYWNFVAIGGVIKNQSICSVEVPTSAIYQSTLMWVTVACQLIAYGIQFNERLLLSQQEWRDKDASNMALILQLVPRTYKLFAVMLNMFMKMYWECSARKL
jgi:hypothetical protein